jgi:two-component system CheB/CheR fusion protein
MPSASGLAFVVIQHLSPDHKSLMAELMAKRTDMPVRRAESGMEVEANHVYLIPPNKNLKIFHGKLLLSDHVRSSGINLPIDIFFKSLAEDQGDKAIAIVLSGTGSDGTRGIRAIKEEVGMVMVQSEESAGFDGMPRSAISTGLVDYILSPEEMPKQLLSYAKHPYASKAELSDTLLTDEDGFARIFAMLREKTKVDFTHYKPSTVVRRIERRMTINQICDLRDYVRYMEGYTVEVTNLYRDLLIGVTNFFRDQEAFSLLGETYIPELLSDPSLEDEVRIWVAGCSTGEEAYSLAMLCQEVLERLGRKLDVKIFATDVDRDAIVQASAGAFPESIAADVSPTFLSKYFYRREEGFQISRQIREMVVFAQHNIIKDPPFTNIRFISCRNLLIYLQPILQKKVLQLFNFALSAQGILFLGSSETTGDLSDFFEPLNQKWRLYRSKGRRGQAGLSEAATTFDPANRFRGRAVVRSSIVARAHEEERLLDRFLDGVSADYLPFCMVVNDSMELLHVTGDASRYLRFPSGKLMNDVSKLVNKDLAIPLSTGLQKTFNSNNELSYSNIHLRDGNTNQIVAMRLKPLPTKKGQEPLVAILIEETRHNTEETEPTVVSYDVGREAAQRIADLEQELQFTRENLQATVEELETSNEELQATNEELLASNEELQSTNEELQSVNEELYTVNAEYQGKISELTGVNNDLDNLLSNTRVATLFLDENLDIRRFTSEATGLFKLMRQDIGRPFSHIAHELKNVDLADLAVQVQHSGEAIEMEVQSISGDYFLMRVLPYQIAPEIYAGIVLTYINITKAKAMEDALRASNLRYRLANVGNRVGSWEWNVVSGDLTWSDNIEPMFGFAKGTFPGTYEAFVDRIHSDDRDSVRMAVENSLNQGVEYCVNHRIVWPDGSVHWMNETGSVIASSDGESIRMLGVVQDITEHHQAEQESRKLENKLSSIMRAVPTGIGIVNHRVIEWANNRMLSMTGYSAQEIEGKNSRFLYLSDETYDDVGREKYRQIRQHGTGTVETQWRRKDGLVIDVLLSSSPLNLDDINSQVIFSAMDISGRKKIERALISEQYQLTSLLETMMDAYILIDEQGVIEKINPAFERLFGYSMAQIKGRNVSLLVPMPHHDWHDDYMRRYLENGESTIIGVGRKVSAQHKKGNIFDIDLTVSALLIDGKRFFSGLIRVPDKQT